MVYCSLLLRFIIQEEFKLSEASQYSVSEISKSEVRIILLYCTQAEAKVILTNGAKVGLNTSNYLWIVTQSVVGDTGEKMMGLADSYHVGMLGVHFNPSLNPDNTAVLRVRPGPAVSNTNVGLQEIMPLAVKIFAKGAADFLSGTDGSLDYQLSCHANNTRFQWGDTFLK